jgi:hypothetical protein
MAQIEFMSLVLSIDTSERVDRVGRSGHFVPRTSSLDRVILYLDNWPTVVKSLDREGPKCNEKL